VGRECKSSFGHTGTGADKAEMVLGIAGTAPHKRSLLRPSDRSVPNWTAGHRTAREMEMRYLICVLYLILVVLCSDRGFALDSPDCSKIANASDRVKCKVDSQILKTPTRSPKKKKAK
jgi:hypothetical protein